MLNCTAEKLTVRNTLLLPALHCNCELTEMQKECVGAGVVRTWYLPAGCLEHHTAIVSLCLPCTATHMSCSTSRLKSSTLWLSAKVMTVWISMVNNVLALVICMYKLLIGCWTYKSIGSQCTTVGCRSSFWAVVCVSWHCSLALQRTSSLVAVLIKAFFLGNDC